MLLLLTACYCCCCWNRSLFGQFCDMLREFPEFDALYAAERVDPPPPAAAVAAESAAATTPTAAEASDSSAAATSATASSAPHARCFLSWLDRELKKARNFPIFKTSPLPRAASSNHHTKTHFFTALHQAARTCSAAPLINPDHSPCNHPNSVQDTNRLPPAEQHLFESTCLSQCAGVCACVCLSVCLSVCVFACACVYVCMCL
jgi:hypothetical protein